ncbi:MAG: hypothetical protein H0U23_16315 [Blastocatellia bacterium]|nr:hypothetical protein [Blastocatellia bacterium]
MQPNDFVGRERDHFERGDDSQDSYYKVVQKILWQGWRDDVVLRMIVRPPFDKEYIVGVRRVGRQYRCFVINPTSHIWSEEVKRHTAGAGKPNFSRIEGKFEETPVREDVVTRIAAIWRKGLNDPKSYLGPQQRVSAGGEEERVIYLDSTEFYFFVGLLPKEHLTGRTVESAGRNAAPMLRVGFGLPVYVWHGTSEKAYFKTLSKAEKELGIDSRSENLR